MPVTYLLDHCSRRFGAVATNLCSTDESYGLLKAIHLAGTRVVQYAVADVSG